MSTNDVLQALRPILAQVLRDLSTADAHYEAAIGRALRYATTLENDSSLGVLGTRIGGSVGKRTAVRPLSDVDLYVYLDAATWTTTRGEQLLPTTVISRMKMRMRHRIQFEVGLGHAGVRAQGHSVGIRFRRRDSVGIDVVPALVVNGNLNEAFIPRRWNNTFVLTSIERQIELLEGLDTPFRYLARAIRLLKVWSNQSGMPLLPYALEVLAMHQVTAGCPRTEAGVFWSVLDFIGSTDMREPVFIPHFFDFSPPRRRACVILDPAIQDNNLGASLSADDGDRMGAAARFTLARLRKAAEHAAAGREGKAHDAVAAAFGRSLAPIWEPERAIGRR